MVDYQAKYEFLLRNVLSDLNTEVLVAQGRAEKNAEGENLFHTHSDSILSPQHTASSVYCTELKERLRESEQELEEARNKLAVLDQELRSTQSQLAEARQKLEVYVEREKTVGRETEPVKI